MTDIDVPLWVVDKALDAWDELSGHPSEEHRMRAALRAALSAWVVPELFVSRDGIDAVRDARRRDVMAYTKAWNDAISSQMVPLYTLRQEKPE